MFPGVRHVEGKGPRGYDFSTRPADRIKAVLGVMADKRPYAEALTSAEAIAELERILTVARQALNEAHRVVEHLELIAVQGLRRLRGLKKR